MALKANIVANYFGRGWASLSIFIFVPIYLHLLGEASYGLVAFYSTLFSVLSISNIGLSATLMRELARSSADNSSADQTRNLVRTIETLFFCIGLAVVTLVALVAPWIGTRWLNAPEISLDRLTLYLRLMGVAIALRFPIDMYYAGMNGLQRQITSNSYQAIFSTLRNVLAVAVLAWLAPTVQAFFISQIIVSVIEFFLARRKLWNLLPTSEKSAHFDAKVIHSIYRYAIGVASITIISVLLNQVDKIVVSKALTIEIFGVYSVAALLARLPLVVGQPIADAVYPRLTQLVAMKKQHEIKSFYIRVCSYLAVVVYPTGLAIGLFSRDILYAWTQNGLLADQAAVPSTILALGTIIIAVLSIPSYLALANGWTSLNLILGLSSLIVILPLTIVLTKLWGINGAAVGWLVLNAGILPPYILALHKRLMPKVSGEWFIRSNLIPLLIALAVLGCSSYLLKGVSSSMVRMTAIATSWIVATSLVALSFREIRDEIKVFIRLHPVA